LRFPPGQSPPITKVMSIAHEVVRWRVGSIPKRCKLLLIPLTVACRRAVGRSRQVSEEIPTSAESSRVYFPTSDPAKGARFFTMRLRPSAGRLQRKRILKGIGSRLSRIEAVKFDTHPWEKLIELFMKIWTRKNVNSLGLVCLGGARNHSA